MGFLIQITIFICPFQYKKIFLKTIFLFPPNPKLSLNVPVQVWQGGTEFFF